MSESGRNTSSSEWNLRDEPEFASYGVASSNSSKWSNLKRNDELKPTMGFSCEEPVSGRKGSNKDDIANTNYGVWDATNAQDTDGSYNMQISPGLDEDYKNKCNQSLKDGCSKLFRSRSRSPPRSFRWDSGRVGGLTQPYCRDFVAGKCRRGNRCRFLHHDDQNYGNSWENRHIYSAPNENNNYSRTIGRSYNRTCFHYAQGRCKMGASCKYVHHDNFDRRRTESCLEQGVQHGSNQNRLHGESTFSSDIKKSNWAAKNDSANVHTSQTVGADIWLDNEKMSPPNWIYDVRSSIHINQEQGQSKQQVAPGQVLHQNVSKTFIKPEPVVRFPKQRDPTCNSREQKNVNATGGVSLAYFPNRQLVKNEHPVQLKGIHTFKFSLVEFVKELLNPTWKDGKITKEDYKAIVKKVTDKVIDTVQGAHIPQTQEKIDCYLSSSKSKLNKLVQAYVEKFQKA
ncbi:hypothetical protein GLYMA_05G190500v4 [Glycine max]|uniref:C3H1-type domain-containing protein n=1 Tax=Glycine max TaxID=3847 RepID=K7KR55_SOYBN|nr:uncharacterized protein LOC102670057 [Glycine max]KAG5041283.1 hypothetical protein JHK85_013759 [Glycine max]KAH1135214.1 hypothetical protein GYH30_013137 [Glycine max]KRH59558.1 hypothetical protein GLYMA_05G190500v4 [Glycine max]|eukprot:XP_014631271.1 uncharacterized protein LOC102670057 [Glycine max]